MPRTVAQLKQTYCFGDNTNCARYLVASKGIPAPPDLFPNEQHRAYRFLIQLKIGVPAKPNDL
jgi:hypothetical protein